MEPLKGRVALVTGGVRGVGAAINKVLAREMANVVIVDMWGPEAEAVVETLDGENSRVCFFTADIGDEQEAQRVIRELVAEFEKLNIDQPYRD